MWDFYAHKIHTKVFFFIYMYKYWETIVWSFYTCKYKKYLAPGFWVNFIRIILYCKVSLHFYTYKKLTKVSLHILHKCNLCKSVEKPLWTFYTYKSVEKPLQHRIIRITFTQKAGATPTTKVNHDPIDSLILCQSLPHIRCLSL